MIKGPLILLLVVTTLPCLSFFGQERSIPDLPTLAEGDFEDAPSDFIFEEIQTPRIKPPHQEIHIHSINKPKLKIMVIDTGVANHPFLKPWLKFSKKNNDTEGHGTHVAGLIAYGPMNDAVISKLDPLCSEVEIIPCQALSFKTESDEVKIHKTLSCLDKALKMKVDIINYSGGGALSGVHEFEKWKRFSDRGGIIVAASGNNSEDISKNPYYPASWGVLRDGKVMIKNLYPISSTDEEGYIASFSNVGPNVIYEQGQNLISTYLNDSFTPMSGTSMAAPVFTHKIAKSFCRNLQARNERANRNIAAVKK